MKKLLFALPAILLAIFMSGCGKSPDAELSSKVPASADWLCFVDGKLAVQTQLYKEFQKDLVAWLKKESLSEDLFRSRFLIFGFTKEGWGGMLIQSTDGQARKFYDVSLADSKKEKSFKDLKEASEGSVRKYTGRVNNGQTEILVVLYHDNLVLVGVNKTDSAFFNAKSANPLFKQISLKGNIISAAVKAQLPPPGKVSQIDMALQAVPALKKLQSIALNVPFSADKPELDFRATFENDAAANEVLAAVNMGLGAATKSGDKDAVRIAGMIKRKAEKNAVRISFPLTDAAKEVKNAMQEAQKRARRISSANNLKQIGLACKMFAIDKDGKMPNDLNALVKGGYLSDRAVYISPLDSRRKAAAGKEGISPSNTSYAYVGKGLSEGVNVDLPLAFEKPDVVANNGGFCSVLYMGGHVMTTKVKGRTCAAIARELTRGQARSQADAKAVAIIMANAAAEGRAEK